MSEPRKPGHDVAMTGPGEPGAGKDVDGSRPLPGDAGPGADKGGTSAPDTASGVAATGSGEREAQQDAQGRGNASGTTSGDGEAPGAAEQGVAEDREAGQSDATTGATGGPKGGAGRKGLKEGLAGRMAHTFVRSPVTPLLYLAALLFGLIGFLVVPYQENPQISVPFVDIFVQYPGLPPSRLNVW